MGEGLGEGTVVKMWPLIPAFSIREKEIKEITL
jgi:hypothetical protein